MSRTEADLARSLTQWSDGGVGDRACVENGIATPSRAESSRARAEDSGPAAWTFRAVEALSEAVAADAIGRSSAAASAQAVWLSRTWLIRLVAIAHGQIADIDRRIAEVSQ